MMKRNEETYLPYHCKIEISCTNVTFINLTSHQHNLVQTYLSCYVISFDLIHMLTYYQKENGKKE